MDISLSSLMGNHHIVMKEEPHDFWHVGKNCQLKKIETTSNDFSVVTWFISNNQNFCFLIFKRCENSLDQREIIRFVCLEEAFYQSDITFLECRIEFANMHILHFNSSMALVVGDLDFNFFFI